MKESIDIFLKRLLAGTVFFAVLWSGTASDARQVALTILHTTDIHGHVLPPLENPYAEKGGSLLRCAALIEQIRAREPNVLLVDSGDALQGSAESWLTGGRLMIRAMESMRYDAWALGNHDFDWGIENLSALCATTRVPVLAANIQFPPGVENALPTVRPFVLKEIDGVRVLIAGLTTPGIPSWLREDVIGPIQFTRSEETLARLMPSIRQLCPDVMLLLVHQGYSKGGDDFANEVAQIARKFPEFDVMLGGHLHWVLPGIRLDGVLFAQAGNYAQGVGRVDLVYDTVQRRVVDKRGEFLEVDASTAEYAPLRSMLGDDLARATNYLGEIIGTNAVLMDAALKIPGQSPVQQLLCLSIAEVTRADGVLHGVLATEPIEAGPVRRSDIWRIVPYENRVGIVHLNPQELKQILEEASDYAGSGHYQGVYGLAFDFCPSAPQGERIANLRYADGRNIHPKRRLKIAFNSHTLASAGGRYATLRSIVERPASRLEMTNIDTRSAVVNYVRSHSPLNVPAGSSVRIIRAGSQNVK
ncbi:MAG TPA: hypothetical protein DCZ95_12825 [Verrucomicrobia bacterium]|nr:MAG: hypothetical protein A2X46_11835 [Lentisphaerae bacterium GWF2_57_35]HBA84971.1 hypothetical protein [Verrucomicrobiota bacterium]